MGQSTMKKTNLPPITDAIPEIKEAKVQPETKLEADPVKLQTGLIEVPLGPLPGYIVRRVDTNRMNSKQSEALAAITSGLEFKEARLIDGTFVKTEMHAIKWMLENVLP